MFNKLINILLGLLIITSLPLLGNDINNVVLPNKWKKWEIKNEFNLNKVTFTYYFDYDIKTETESTANIVCYLDDKFNFFVKRKNENEFILLDIKELIMKHNNDYYNLLITDTVNVSTLDDFFDETGIVYIILKNNEKIGPILHNGEGDLKLAILLCEYLNYEEINNEKKIMY